MARSRIILHIDMDSFYASVEIRERPELTGLPVVVGADPKDGKGRGVVVTASYEARSHGIHSAMPISRAWRICPHAVYIRPHFPLYVGVSREIMEILSRYADRFEPVSIDEAYLDISPTGNYPAAENLARQIKDEIREKERLTCSIGIGPNKLIAKIASDFKKPDGLTVIDPGHVQTFLSPLPVEKIPGIGRKTAAELHRMGITTIGALGCHDVQAMISHFGKGGIILQGLARGEDEREIGPREGTRSIGREYTFEHDTDDLTELTGILDTLATDVYATLREDGFLFRTVTVKVRYEGFITRTKSRSLEHPAIDLSPIRALSRALLLEFPHGKKIRLIGLRLSGLTRQESQQKTISEFSS
jgi:DNA polymerase IV (DinB-like DNA polymerase)